MCCDCHIVWQIKSVEWFSHSENINCWVIVTSSDKYKLLSDCHIVDKYKLLSDCQFVWPISKNAWLSHCQTNTNYIVWLRVGPIPIYFVTPIPIPIFYLANILPITNIFEYHGTCSITILPIAAETDMSILVSF